MFGSETILRCGSIVRPFNPCAVSCSLDEMVIALNNNLTGTLNKVAPLKIKKRSCNKTSPWIDNTFHELKRSCRAARKKWRKTGLEVHCRIYKEYIVTYNNTLRTARRAYFSVQSGIWTMKELLTGAPGTVIVTPTLSNIILNYAHSLLSVSTSL